MQFLIYFAVVGSVLLSVLFFASSTQKRPAEDRFFAELKRQTETSRPHSTQRHATKPAPAPEMTETAPEMATATPNVAAAAPDVAAAAPDVAAAAPERQQLRPMWPQLRPPWQRLRPMWQRLRPTWQQLRPMWQQLRPTWQRLRPTRHLPRWSLASRRPIWFLKL